MKKWNLLEQTPTPGGSIMALYERDGVYVIRVDGAELMSSRHFQSEVELAEVACQPLSKKPTARVLIGGLGLGYTLKAALTCLPANSRCIVAELLPQVVEWNKNRNYALAADAVADPRTHIVIDDVANVIAKSPGAFDAIMLDADNNTTPMTTEGNRSLYLESGVGMVLAALKPGGMAVYWSATPDPKLERQMGLLGFKVEARRVRAHLTSGGSHVLIIGRT